MVAITASHSRTAPYRYCRHVDGCVDYLTLKPRCAVQITGLPPGVFPHQGHF